MYLKIWVGMFFRVYYYQMKIYVFSYKNMGEIEFIFYVIFYGINVDFQILLLEIVEWIEQNVINIFLVYIEEDLGDFLKIQFIWEGVFQFWYNLWKEFCSYLF